MAQNEPGFTGGGPGTEEMSPQPSSGQLPPEDIGDLDRGYLGAQGAWHVFWHSAGTQAGTTTGINSPHPPSAH